MINWIIDNKEWLLSGLGISVLASMKWIIKLFSHNKDRDKNSISNVINQTINIDNKDIVDNTENSNERKIKKSKSTVVILFIDDNKVSFIQAMKKAGYTIVRYLKDCNNIHIQYVVDADIIFVDVNGVAMTLFPKEQGFGLAKAIKEQYPNKCVVLYSAEPQYLRKDYNILDSVLPKNSEPYEFIKIIDDWIQS